MAYVCPYISSLSAKVFFLQCSEHRLSRYLRSWPHHSGKHLRSISYLFKGFAHVGSPSTVGGSSPARKARYRMPWQRAIDQAVRFKEEKLTSRDTWPLEVQLLRNYTAPLSSMRCSSKVDLAVSANPLSLRCILHPVVYDLPVPLPKMRAYTPPTPSIR